MRLKNFFKVVAGLAVVAAMFSCKEVLVRQNTLSVVPSAALIFEAYNSQPVTLAVETDADSWDFTAPEWVGAVKGEDGTTLVVTPQDYDGNVNRVGQIVFTAGDAVPFKINVLQNTAPAEVTASIVMENGENEVKASLLSDSPVYKAKVKVVIDKAVNRDLVFNLALDNDYAAEYAYTHNISTQVFPAEKISECQVTVAAGELESELVEVTFDATDVQTQTNYIASLVADPTSLASGVSFEYGKERVTYCILKKLPKTVKNVVYLEVNNTNPLNMLEYKLEDGSPFFDVVILFAGNINYDAESDIVYFAPNPNVQALLNESEIYIQPLRDAGMEVQMGLLPNHTPAGLVNLTKQGADMFAEEIAELCYTYKLDGVSMDEEYRSGSATSPLIGSPSGQNAQYLCWKIKQELAEKCSWPCQVSVFDYNWSWGKPTVDGVEYNEGDCVDFIVGNYGATPSPKSGMTQANCSRFSFECNLRSYSVSTYSQTYFTGTGNYGWYMWFAFHPQIGGGLGNNATKMDPIIKNAAKGLYNMDLVTPTHYYTKLGEGKYSPERIERSW